MAEAPKWYEAYPEPRSKNPGAVSARELITLFQLGETAGTDFLLIDLRRTDHEVSIFYLLPRANDKGTRSSS